MNGPTFLLRHAWALLLLCLPIVAGCATQQTASTQAEAIQLEANQAAAACRKYFGVSRAQITKREQCINAVTERFYPNNPRTQLSTALRLELAEKVRDGKSTFAKANADLVREMVDAQRRQYQTKAPRQLPQPSFS